MPIPANALPTSPFPAIPSTTGAFLERLITFLIPYFLGFGADRAAARSEALETLLSYGARTRAEFICAVQIIVFSFAALDTLAAANMPEMSPSMRLRFRGCANNLNRSSQKTEQTLAKRLAADMPEVTDTTAEPANDLSDADAEDLLQQTQAKITAYRNRASASRLAHTPTPASHPATSAAALQPSTLNPSASPALASPAPASTPAANAPAQNPRPDQHLPTASNRPAQQQPDRLAQRRTSPLPRYCQAHPSKNRQSCSRGKSRTSASGVPP